MYKKGKILLYALISSVGLYFFFHTWGVYTLLRQEEVQLFLPVWSEIARTVLSPGGICELLGKAIVQYYTGPTETCLILSSLLTIIGILAYLLQERFTSSISHFFLAWIPVWALAKAHCSPFYILDGTIGILFLLFFLYLYTCIRKPLFQYIFNLFSTVLMYWIGGQLVAPYGILTCVWITLHTPKLWKQALCPALLGIFLTVCCIRWTACIPLTDGIYSQAYQESQLQPDSYMYFIWIRWTALLLTIFVITHFLRLLPWESRRISIGTTVLSGAAFSLFALAYLPAPEDIHNNQMEKLSYLYKQYNLDAIFKEFSKQHPTNYLQLNYLCLALAQHGELADKLFTYQPQKPQSLLATWDRSYFTSTLLADIHYTIGDITLAESYAMEGLTLAKRGGSPRMLQLLVKISLIRQEWELAKKYLHILHQMPQYYAWAKKYHAFLYHPQKVKQDAELGRFALSKQSDKLFSLLTVDELWLEHIGQKQPNTIAESYLGCSYLLAKELDKFEKLIGLTNSKEQIDLPRHFQEALLIKAIDQPTLVEKYLVRNDILQHFKQFQLDIRKVPKDNRGLLQLQRKYGDTYWFYYYCKN